MSRTVAVLILAVALAAAAAGCGGGGSEPPPGAVPNPLRYQDGARRDYERRAAAGLAHVLYAKSPGGVLAAAARTARWRGAVEQAAHDAGVDPDLVEAVVFLESGGRPEVVAGGSDPANATGLTQIVASTATSLLGMHVDVAASRRLGGQIAATDRAAQRDPGTPRARAAARRAAALRTQRRAVDERFDPARALAGTARYLKLARRRLHREDLAFVSYHMGIGNLERVIADFGGGDAADLPYARLYFDSTPLRHATAYVRLIAFGDDSSTYYWRLLAARDVMRRYRRDAGGLAREAALQVAADSGARALHPPGHPDPFGDRGALRAARDDGTLVALPPGGASAGFARGASVGGGARWALRPAAAVALRYLAAGVRRIAPASSPPLTVLEAASTSDASSPDALAATGYSFALARRYGGHPQAEAVQFMLDRLQAMDLIAWSRGKAALEITAADGARGLAHWLRGDGRLRDAS